MQQIAIFIVTLVLLFSVGSIGWFYIRFEWLPIRVKARAIMKAVAVLRAGKEEYAQKRHSISRNYDARIESVRDETLHKMFQAIPLGKLDEYPGIGPATVEKLRNSGYEDLPALTEGHLESISGFGEKRAADIRNALRALHKEAASRLDSGACPESRQVEIQKMALQKEKDYQLAECDFWNQWRIRTLNGMKDSIDLAEQVAFFPWLFDRPLPRDLPDPPNLTPPTYAPAPQVVPPKPVQPPPPQLPISVPARPSEVLRTEKTPEARRSKSEVAYRIEPEMAKRGASATPLDSNWPWVPRDDMEIVARIGMAVGVADGRFSEKEQLVLRRFLNEIYGGDLEKKNRIGNIFAECQQQLVDLDHVLAAAAIRVPRSLWPTLMTMVQELADTGGRRVAQETATIERIRAKLSTSFASKTTTQVQRPQSPENALHASPHSIATSQPSKAASDGTRSNPMVSPRKNLEILESVPLTARLVRTQWQAMREKFDPSKFAGHGQEFIAMAEAKRQAADEAAKLLLQELGEVPTLEEPVKDLRHNPDLDAAFGL